MSILFKVKSISNKNGKITEKYNGLVLTGIDIRFQGYSYESLPVFIFYKDYSRVPAVVASESESGPQVIYQNENDESHNLVFDKSSGSETFFTVPQAIPDGLSLEEYIVKLENGEIVGGKKKKKSQPVSETYKKTSHVYVDEDGIKRVLYSKGDKFYVKRRIMRNLES